MVWGWVSTKCLENFHYVYGTPNVEKYQNILAECLLPGFQGLHRVIFHKYDVSLHIAKSTNNDLPIRSSCKIVR